jgi:hypothetical protein
LLFAGRGKLILICRPEKRVFLRLNRSASLLAARAKIAYQWTLAKIRASAGEVETEAVQTKSSMPNEKDLKAEIGPVLFLAFVRHSKLLIKQQRDLRQTLTDPRVSLARESAPTRSRFQSYPCTPRNSDGL